MSGIFQKETDLCAAFIASLPKGWTAYNETGGFDILLARDEDGFQIGIEAKLKLNAKVICQAAESVNYFNVDTPGPDCRAVLIPSGVSLDMARVCAFLGITVIRQGDGTRLLYGRSAFAPLLPKLQDATWSENWHERAPASRIPLPDYVPDVGAGDSSPLRLTPWKVKAIKIAVTLEKRGYITRADFKHHKISMSMWTQSKWIKLDGARKVWTANRVPDFRAQHPTNYAQIEADYSKWMMDPSRLPAVQKELFGAGDGECTG